MASLPWKALLELCRVSNLPTVWTNVLAAAVLATGRFPLAGYLLAALSLSLFYCAGMVLNDIYDAEVDRQARSTRPIPSGRVLLPPAQALVRLLFAAAFGSLLFLPYRRSALAALLLTVAIIAYDRWHKGHPASVLLMALCRFLVFMVAALALSGRVAPAVVAAGLAQFLYVIILSLVARWENRRPQRFSTPVIPLMIAGISLVDGLVLAIVAAPAWLLAGVGGMVATLLGQRLVRGD